MNLIRFRLFQGVALVGASLFLCGCGGDTNSAVSGKITYKGAAVTSGMINFQKPGTTLGGPIGADGSYAYKLPAGQYQVRIDAPGVTPPWKEGDPEPKPVPRLAPAKYADFAASGLSITVTGEANQQQDFALE